MRRNYKRIVFKMILSAFLFISVNIGVKFIYFKGVSDATKALKKNSHLIQKREDSPDVRFEKFNKSKEYFSQVGEDLIISIAFAHKMGDKGYYIDVGAHSPSGSTVTKYFYDKGWSGINIEPQKALFEQLKAERPRDINLNLAIDDKNTNIKLLVIEDSTGLTTVSNDQIHLLEKQGHKTHYEIVPAMTLDEVYKKYAKDKQIDFLKIDVEGHEKNVLVSFDLKKYQPKVICIEAVEPGTLQQAHDKWEKILLDAEFQFEFFDGINRYYVHKSQKQIINAFITVRSLWKSLGWS